MVTFEYYLKNKNGSKPRTIQNYLDTVTTFLNTIKNKDVITEEDILKYVEHCRDEKHHKNTTIRLRLVAIKTYCDYRSFKDIAQFICKVKLTKQKKTRVVNEFTPDILFTLRDYQTREKSYRNRLLVDLLAGTGGRVSEVLAVTLNSFRTNSDGLKVVDLYQTKIEEMRTVVLSKVAEQSLLEYVRAKNITDKTANLFYYLNSKSEKCELTRFAADKILKRDLAKIGQKPQSCHKLRHFYCSYWSGEVDNSYQLQQIMGHRSRATTDKYVDRTDTHKFDSAHREFLGERLNVPVRQEQEAVVV